MNEAFPDPLETRSKKRVRCFLCGRWIEVGDLIVFAPHPRGARARAGDVLPVHTEHLVVEAE